MSNPDPAASPEPGEHSAAGGVCPFHGQAWQERPKADSIPCPALLSFYNNGWLNPDDSGTDALPGSFNLFALRDSKLDHSGSTGIRDPEVNPEN